jgi:hypothetical protein
MKQKPIVSKSQTTETNDDFVFGKENYIIMLIGIAFLIVGFFLLSGGNSEDPNVFNPEVFSARRIIVAPIVIMLGFGIEIYAILKKTKE